MESNSSLAVHVGFLKRCLPVSISSKKSRVATATVDMSLLFVRQSRVVVDCAEVVIVSSFRHVVVVEFVSANERIDSVESAVLCSRVERQISVSASVAYRSAPRVKHRCALLSEPNRAASCR